MVIGLDSIYSLYIVCYCRVSFVVEKKGVAVTNPLQWQKKLSSWLYVILCVAVNKKKKKKKNIYIHTQYTHMVKIMSSAGFKFIIIIRKIICQLNLVSKSIGIIFIRFLQIGNYFLDFSRELREEIFSYRLEPKPIGCASFPPHQKGGWGRGNWQPLDNQGPLPHPHSSFSA